MGKARLAAQATSGIALVALLCVIAQADTVEHTDISALELDMATAATKATERLSGNIIEAELELDGDQAIWEIDIVNSAQQVTTVEVDARTGQIMGTESDDDTRLSTTDTVSLAKAIEIVKSVESGALIEAELENERGELIWEVETLGQNNQESTVRIHAETGEILI